MKSKQLSLPRHPLTRSLRMAAESVSTSLSESSIRCYRGTIRHFLGYLGAEYPRVRSLDQLRRDPHLIGWLALLRSHNPPLVAHSRARYVIHLRRVFDELAWIQQLPALARLLGPDDIPRKEHCLPRPLTPEQDQLIQQELFRRNDFLSTVLLLLRHTGMRIGECIDLSVDCLRAIGPDQWAIHVPLGKLKTERLVAVDSLVCRLVERLRSMRPPNASSDRLLLPRGRGRWLLPIRLRDALRDAARAVGITVRIVPHQFRHTYAKELLRAGVTLAAVMKLLGHKTPHMTLHYLEITQADLHREYQLARAHTRHLAPALPAPFAVSSTVLDPTVILSSLQSAQHVLEMFRRTLPEGASRRLLDRLSNRLVKISAVIRKLNKR
jgi:site-specific recombinase XerD